MANTGPSHCTIILVIQKRLTTSRFMPFLLSVLGEMGSKVFTVHNLGAESSQIRAG